MYIWYIGCVQASYSWPECIVCDHSWYSWFTVDLVKLATEFWTFVASG